MEVRIIKSPTRGTVEIIKNRVGVKARTDFESVPAIGLVQGRMIEMMCAVDIAEKAVGVTVEDVKGSCPQNMIMIAIFGDTSSVEAALREIKEKMANGYTV